MSARDVILTTLHRVRFEYAANFLASLRRTGYEGEAVIFASCMSDETITELQRHGATVVRFEFKGKFIHQRWARLWPLWRWMFARNLSTATKEKLAHGVFHLFYRRHLLYLQFLREHRTKYDRVFLTDCRDVYFQADPFGWNPHGLHLFLEEPRYRIKDSPHNSAWLRHQFGEAVLDQMKDEYISCAGTTFGDIQSILGYLEAMVAFSMKARSLEDPDGDQGIHNYLLRSKYFPQVTAHENRRGPVMTLGNVAPEAARLNSQGLVINDDGEVAPVLHQYDRIPHVQKILLERLDGQSVSK
jgi:hypothetical protein